MYLHTHTHTQNSLEMTDLEYGILSFLEFVSAERLAREQWRQVPQREGKGGQGRRGLQQVPGVQVFCVMAERDPRAEEPGIAWPVESCCPFHFKGECIMFLFT